MFTLKIQWQRVVAQRTDLTAVATTDTVRVLDLENHTATIDSIEDEATHFFLADRVTVMGQPDPDMSAWAPSDFRDMRSQYDTVSGDRTATSEPFEGARLIEIEYDGEHSWYLATRAWLLGPTGDTIERLAP